MDLDLDLDVLRSADPGPIDESLLVLQGQHRSQAVWDADRTCPEDCARIRVRRVEAGTHRLQRPSPAVFELIRHARLEGLCSVPFVSLDWGLITALVERWRPETHTFHLRPGEATVTLQDVEVLLGLPVDGKPVTGSTIFNPVEVCERLLGVIPEAKDLKGGKVKFKWLRDRFTGQVEDGAEQEVVARQARGYLLLLLGGTIFADHTGGYVHLGYLQLLENFDVAGEYSWGSGALANLYHNLCHGATRGKEMTGPFVLLQVWAWERLPYLAPGRLGKRAPMPGSPLIGRWDDAFGCSDLATHVVGAYRHYLDIQRADEVKWNPYSEELLDSLPEYCRAGRAVWRASVPLIFFATVEFHQPERVLRQFGFHQGIPSQSRAQEPPHGKTLQSGKKDWAAEYAPAIAIWNARLQHVVEAGSPDVPEYPFDDPYVAWYNRMSRRCISRVGAGIDGATRCFQALTRSGVPNTFRDIGLAGLQHLAVLEKFLRLSPPKHRVFQEPEADEEEQQLGEEGQGLPELPIPQQEAAGEGQDDAHVDHPAEQLVLAPRGGRVSAAGNDSPASHASASKAPPRVPTPAADLLVAEGSSSVDAGGGTTAGTCKDQAKSSAHTAEQPSTSKPVTCHLFSSPLEETLAAGLDSFVTPKQATVLPVRASLENQSQTHTPPQIPISWPSDSILTFNWIMSLMDAFEWGSRNLPPSEFSSICPVMVLDSIILSASTILQKEPNCVHIDGLGDDSSVVVVGDVHGQLHDLIFLLRDAGFPADNRVFVFNGDYVDRGAWGLETFLLLLAWKVSMPEKVFLLRGNHESKYCTHLYGFEKEVLTKYGEQGNDVYQKCLRCFGTLPLASIIVGRVYTAHGGLFRSVATTSSKKRKKTRNSEESSLVLGSLDELSRARRTVLNPPWKGPNLIPGDILWSDPSMNPGLSLNKERGMGLLWGPDCTEDFLQKFNLKLIIRSHEGPDAREKGSGLGGMDDGYTIDHVVESGKLVTLFSAPDYPQFQATEERRKNKGAYIVLEPPHFDSPVFHTFEAITPRPKANPYYEYEDVINSGEKLDLASMVS